MTSVVLQRISCSGPLLMLAAAMLFTALNLIIKLLGPHFRIWDIAVYRFLGGMVLIILIYGRHRNPFSGNNIRLLITRGCTGSIAFLSLVTAIRLLPVSNALVLFYTFPAFAALFAALLFGDRISKGGLLAMGVVLLGIMVFLDFHLEGTLFGQLLAINAALFAGLTVALIRELRASNGAVVIYLYFCTVGLAVNLPMFVSAPTVPVNALEWLLCGGIVFTSLSAQLLMNQGFAYCRSWEGGLFMTSEVVFTALVGIMFLGDPIGWRFWVGGLMIVGSAVGLNLSHRKA